MLAAARARRRGSLIETASLLGAHLTPLSAQLTAPVRRHLPKALKRFAHSLLLFRRQALELLPALAQDLALFRWHRAPLAEPLLRARPLFRRHREPTLTALG